MGNERIEILGGSIPTSIANKLEIELPLSFRYSALGFNLWRVDGGKFGFSTNSSSQKETMGGRFCDFNIDGGVVTFENAKIFTSWEGKPPRVMQGDVTFCICEDYYYELFGPISHAISPEFASEILGAFVRGEMRSFRINDKTMGLVNDGTVLFQGQDRIYTVSHVAIVGKNGNLYLAFGDLLDSDVILWLPITQGESDVKCNKCMGRGGDSGGVCPDCNGAGMLKV